MKIVVLGAVGQLGRDLCPRLVGEVIPLTRAEVDLSRPDDLRRSLDSIRPAVVINCAAYNFVDRAESEPEAAFAVNTWAVRALAIICRDLDALLVHVSTDYVFGLDSMHQKPWRENDPAGPVSVYGLSKLSGEYLVRATCRHLVIRTCGLYGHHGSGGKGGNFVLTMLKLAEQKKPLRVIDDQHCTPTSTADLADAMVSLLDSSAMGLFHLTNSGSCSWHQFAQTIFRLAKVEADLTPIPSKEYPTAARRPAYSVLDCTKAASVGVGPLQTWQESLERFLHSRNQIAE